MFDQLSNRLYVQTHFGTALDFQRLYNYFEGRRLLDTDGVYGPQTDSRVSKYRARIAELIKAYPNNFQDLGSKNYARSVKNYQGLNPGFLAEFLMITQKLDLESFTVIEGLRSYSEQTKLWNQGRTTRGRIVTNAKAGYSMHNFGEALDFALFDSRGLYITDNDRYDAVAAQIRGKDSAGVLEFGAYWNFKDSPHIQARKSTRDTREKFRLLTK
jgi:peptidoglycan L-alanyl-D-glutamate endopeptidase CwlK